VQKPLYENLPQLFKDRDFTESLDEASKRWLNALFRSLSTTKSSNNNSKTQEKNVFKDYNNFQNQNMMQPNNPFPYEGSIYFNGETKYGK